MWLTLTVEWEGRLTIAQHDRPMSSQQVFTATHAIHSPVTVHMNTTCRVSGQILP